MCDPEKRPKVLHVDDDEGFLYFFRMTFEEIFDITSVGDGQKALETLKEEQFDVVITDYDMPEMSGLELLERIFVDFPGIPVLFYTGQGSEEIARQAFLMGASDYFVKDPRNQILRERIKKAVSRILEMKKSEQEAREREKHYQDLVEISPFAIGMISFGGKVIFLNRAVLELLGAENPEEVLNRSMYDFIYNDDSEDVGKITGALFRGEVDYTRYVHKFVRVDGRKIDVEISAIPVMYKGERVVQAILRDVTEVSHLREALYESEEKYRMLVESIQDGVFIIQDRKLVFTNRPVARNLGYETVEIIGKEIDELIAPEHRDMVINRYYNRQKGDKLPYNYGFNMLHKDGLTRIPVSMQVRLVNFEGRLATIGTLKFLNQEEE